MPSEIPDGSADRILLALGQCWDFSGRAAFEETIYGPTMPNIGQQVRDHWQAAVAWVSQLASPSQRAPALTPAQQAAIKRIVVITIVLSSIFFFLVWIFWNSGWLRFWLQTFTGNWSTEHSEHVEGFQFALSVLFGIMVNWLPLLAAITFFFGFIRPIFLTEQEKQERTMDNLAQAFAVMTATNRRSILSLFSDDDTKAKINEAFDKSSVRAKETIEKMVGPEKAKKIFEAMYDPV